MWTVKTHRWQPKSNRYRTVIISLDPESTAFLDIVAGRGAEAKNMIDPNLKQTIARTQQVDRIVINAIEETIEVYMSPFVERKYMQTRVPGGSPTVGVTITKHADKNRDRCLCHHYDDNHGISGVCLIPGCNCQGFQNINKVKNLIAQAYTERSSQ